MNMKKKSMNITELLKNQEKIERDYEEYREMLSRTPKPHTRDQLDHYCELSILKHEASIAEAKLDTLKWYLKRLSIMRIISRMDDTIERLKNLPKRQLSLVHRKTASA